MVRLGRDGGVQQFENSGLLTLRISDEAYGRILLKLSPNHTQGLQLQTHPNVDKELFKTRTMIGLKNLAKPFPLNTDVGVLKWRFVSQDESAIPLTSKCPLFPYLCSPFLTYCSLALFQSTAGRPTTEKAAATSTSSTNWRHSSWSCRTLPLSYPCRKCCDGMYSSFVY